MNQQLELVQLTTRVTKNTGRVTLGSHIIGYESVQIMQKCMVSFTHRCHPGAALRLLICLQWQLNPTPRLPLPALSTSLPKALWGCGVERLLVLPVGKGGWTDTVFGWLIVAINKQE